MSLKANYVVTTLEGDEIHVVRRFGDIVASQKAYPTIGSKLSIDEQIHLMIAFQCHRRLQGMGVIDKDVSMDEWIDTIHSIDEVDGDDEGDDDPLETPAPEPSDAS